MAKTIEKGDIYFFYRPKVNVERPEGVDDIQRFHMVMLPDEGSNGRLFIVGKKRMPDISSGQADNSEREWMMISLVSKPEAIREELRPSAYQTKTRGEQEEAATILTERAYV